jgi:4-diphosphocytidyl-2-C-methyl-D-erythritol kinase
MEAHERAFAKLTRTLRIVGVRPDGYHLLESEMVTVDFADDLAFVASRSSALTIEDAIAWEREAPGGTDESPQIPSDGSNLVLRALRVAEMTATVRLRKRIPAGAGLGGGSADAAAVLRFAGVTDPELSVTLGADVPFCVAGGRAFVRGVGEIVEPLPPTDLDFVVVTPAFGVSTVAAYQAFDDLGPGVGLNDLERAAIAVEPRLALLRDLIADVAGERPVLAGSGSSYFLECPSGGASALRGEVARAVRARGVVASVVQCSTTGSQNGGRPGE